MKGPLGRAESRGLGWGPPAGPLLRVTRPAPALWGPRVRAQEAGRTPQAPLSSHPSRRGLRSGWGSGHVSEGGVRLTRS